METPVHNHLPASSPPTSSPDASSPVPCTPDAFSPEAFTPEANIGAAPDSGSDLEASHLETVPAPPPAPKSSSLGLWLRDLFISAIASVLIITFLYQPVRVEGTSMLPRLEDRDRLFINKFVYHVSAIERGDVVVFHYPRDPEKSYIKRVIALPGDHLRIDRGDVWVNGKKLTEDYVPEEFRDSKSMAEMIVPDGHFFMMGDHRSISSDSREFGPVERDLIYGKAVFVYWPTKDAGVVH
jgi:signal peptidase I